MKSPSIHLLLMLIIGSSQAQRPEVEIQLKNHDARENQTKEQLLKLISTYDLKRWMFTEKIVIESGFQVIPHSHPILTLNTRHLKDDELLLATFIHEQLHWFIDNHPEQKNIYAQLKLLYPRPHVTFPEGSGGETDTYYHILICHLEYTALKQLLGELRAYQVITFWQQDHYRWIYKTVVEDQQRLNDLVKKYRLTP